MVFLFRENKFSQNVNQIKGRRTDLSWLIGGVRKKRETIREVIWRYPINEDRIKSFSVSAFFWISYARVSRNVCSINWDYKKNFLCSFFFMDIVFAAVFL